MTSDGRSQTRTSKTFDSPRRHSRLHPFLLLLLSMLAASPLALAQATLGSSALGGTVRDTTGAVIPEATVVLVDTDRDLSRTTTTDSSGLFRFPSIPPSHYALKVSKAAFETFNLTAVVVQLGDSKELDVALPIGATASTVTIEADKATLLDTESNVIGSVVEAKTIGNLPLNNQDFLQLAVLTGGVTIPVGTSDNTAQIGHSDRAVITAGLGQAYTAYTINGIATRGSRLGESALNLSTAVIDQFKVQESFFLPDQGPDPGIVNAITKGGTNKLHGEVYDFIKNDYLDARNYFAVLPQDLKRNQFGAAAGAPILKDKLWVFGNYEGTRQVITGNVADITPTAAQFGGDFSALLPTTVIYDPTTYVAATHSRKPFPNNIIPANRINPVAAALLAYYIPGSPTVVNGKNINFAPKSTYNDDQFGVRVDFALTTQQYIFAQYINQNDPQVATGDFPDSGTLFPNSNRLFVLQHTWTLSPTLINTFRLGVVRLQALDSNQARGLGNIANGLGVPNTFDGRGVPTVALSGYTSFGHASGDIGNTDNNYQLDEGMTYLHGTHNYQFGAGIRYFRDSQQNGTAQANSTLTFLPLFTAQTTSTGAATKNTGNAFADFLLGDPSQAITGGLPSIQYRFTQFSPYFADTWKISPTVTLNYGISWFLATTPNPQGIYQTWVHSFDFGTSLPTYHALGQTTTEVVPTPLNHFTPRLGVDFHPENLPNTVIRAAVGTYFSDQSAIETQYGVFAPPYSQNTVLVNSPTNPIPTYNLGNNIFPPIVYPPITPAFPAALAAAGGASIFVENPHARTPYTNQWNLSVEEALTRNDVIDADYLGNSSHKLVNHNDPAACVPNLATRQCNPATNPYPQYASLEMSLFSGNSNYNAFIVNYRHITSNGLTLNADYTYSKSLTDTGAKGGLLEIASCRICDYGPASFDQKHRFVVSFVYELPYGHGKRFGSDIPAPLNLLAGGWVITGISTAGSGTPISITTANTLALPNIVLRPNQLCNGTDQGLQKNLRTNGYHWFNTACYAVPAAGYFGNASINPILGPGRVNFDLGAQKLFPLALGENTRLQLRVEAFNVFNHAEFGLPNGITSTPATFGIITSAASPRVFQAVAKVTF